MKPNPVFECECKAGGMSPDLEAGVGATATAPIKFEEVVEE